MRILTSLLMLTMTSAAYAGTCSDEIGPDAHHPDPYVRLGVERQATVGEIEKAYRKKAMAHHPDKHFNSPSQAQHEAAFKSYKDAYDELIDEARRRTENGDPLTGAAAILRDPLKYQTLFLKTLTEVTADSPEDVIAEVARLAVAPRETWDKLAKDVAKAHADEWKHHDDYPFALAHGQRDGEMFASMGRKQVFVTLGSVGRLPTAALDVLCQKTTMSHALYQATFALLPTHPEVLPTLARFLNYAGELELETVIAAVVAAQTPPPANAAADVPALPEPLTLALRAAVERNDTALGELFERWPQVLRALYPDVTFTPSSLEKLSPADTMIAIRALRFNDVSKERAQELTRFDELNPEFVKTLDDAAARARFVEALAALGIASEDLPMRELVARENSPTVFLHFVHRDLNEADLAALAADLTLEAPGLKLADRLDLISRFEGEFSPDMRAAILTGFRSTLAGGYSDRYATQRFLKFFYSIDLKRFMPSADERARFREELVEKFANVGSAAALSQGYERMIDPKFGDLLHRLDPRPVAGGSFNLVGRWRVMRLFALVRADRKDAEARSAKFSSDVSQFGTPAYDEYVREFNARHADRDRSANRIFKKLAAMPSLKWMRGVPLRDLAHLLDIKSTSEVKQLLANPAADDLIRLHLSVRAGHSFLSGYRN